MPQDERSARCTPKPLGLTRTSAMIFVKDDQDKISVSWLYLSTSHRRLIRYISVSNILLQKVPPSEIYLLFSSFLAALCSIWTRSYPDSTFLALYRPFPHQLLKSIG